MEENSSMRWYRERRAQLDAERERNTHRPQKSYELKPIQQAALAGLMPGNWGSDHLRELESNKGWTFDAVHKMAMLAASSTLSVSVEPSQVTKGFATAQDAPDEQWETDNNHPAYLLLESPNEFLDGFRFRYQVFQQQALAGAPLIWEVPSQLGNPCRLWCIPRAWAMPMPPSHRFPMGWYRITPYRSYWTQQFLFPSGVTTWEVDARETYLVGWPDALFPGECTSALSACDKLIDTANMTETAVWASMLNGVKPSIAFSIDPKSGVQPTEEQWQQFEAKLTELKSGPHNAGKILGMIGLGVQLLNITPADLEAPANRDQNRKFVQTIHGCSPTISGETEQTAYSAAAVAVNTATELQLQPKLDLFSGILTHRWQRWWGKGAGKPRFRVCFDAKRVDDPTLDLQWVSEKMAGYNARLIKGNEVRAAFKLPPLPELDQLQPQAPAMPAGLPVPGGVPGQSPGTPQPEEDDPLAAFDIGDDPSDETSTGFKRPELQAASGNRMPFSLNGKH